MSPATIVRYVPFMSVATLSALFEQGVAGVHGDMTVPVGPTTTGTGHEAASLLQATRTSNEPAAAEASYGGAEPASSASRSFEISAPGLGMARASASALARSPSRARHRSAW